MLRAAQSARSLSLTASRNKDLVQQAFLDKIKQWGQKGGDLANTDPAVKKALQDELNRLATKFQLANSDIVGKLPTNFEKPQVESSLSQLLEGKTLKELAEALTQEKSAYLASRNAKKTHHEETPRK